MAINYKEKLRSLINESGVYITDGMQSVPGGRKYVYYRELITDMQRTKSGDNWREIYFEILEDLYERLREDL